MLTTDLTRNYPLVLTPPPVWQEVARSSIIIVNYNGGRYLDQCLDSLQFNFNQNDEIIVVDNASTDGSADDLEHKFPRVRVIRSQLNLGFSGGCNLGARAATGHYLAFLNPDTMVVPGWLDTLLEALQNNPQAGLATSRILLLKDKDVINTCGNDVHYTGITLCRGAGAHRDTLLEQDEVDAVSGAAFVISRELFNALDGFDHTFFMYMEDTDLSWRARLAGYRCLYVPESIVYHDYTLRFGPHKTFYQERNRYLKLLKSLNWRTLVALLPALLLAEMITWSFVILRDRKHKANKWRAYTWIATHWSQVMSSRRHTQSLKQVSDHDLLAKCTHRLAYEQTGGGLMARLAHLTFDPLFFSYIVWFWLSSNHLSYKGARSFAPISYAH